MIKSTIVIQLQFDIESETIIQDKSKHTEITNAVDAVTKQFYTMGGVVNRSKLLKLSS